MKQFIVLVAILACAFAKPSVHHVDVLAAPAVAVGPVVASAVPVATSYQKVDRVHNKAYVQTDVVAAVQPVFHPAPVVHAAPVAVHAAPVVHTAPVAVHAAPVVQHSYVHAAPVVHTAPVVAAPALVRSHVVAPAVPVAHVW